MLYHIHFVCHVNACNAFDLQIVRFTVTLGNQSNRQISIQSEMNFFSQILCSRFYYFGCLLEPTRNTPPRIHTNTHSHSRHR